MHARTNLSFFKPLVECLVDFLNANTQVLKIMACTLPTKLLELCIQYSYNALTTLVSARCQIITDQQQR